MGWVATMTRAAVLCIASDEFELMSDDKSEMRCSDDDDESKCCAVGGCGCVV